MKVHNKNLIVLMIISIFVLITTSLVNINLSVKTLKENEIKRLSSEMLIYRKEVTDFYKLFNKYSSFLNRTYENNFDLFTKSVHNIVITDENIKSGEIYNISTKKLIFAGNPANYVNSDWIKLMEKNKNERIVNLDGRIYYLNVLRKKKTEFAYIAFEIDKNVFFENFFKNESYFILDNNQTFMKMEDNFNKELIFKLKTISKSSKSIYEDNSKNSYVYYTYIEGLNWIVGIKGNYFSPKEKFLLIKNFSFSSIMMIIIFGMLGLKSNKENITKPLLDLTDFLMNREDKNVIKNMEFKEKSELNDFVSALDSYIGNQDKILAGIKKSYSEVLEKNLYIIKDLENSMKMDSIVIKKPKSNLLKNLKKSRENSLKILLRTEKSLNYLEGGIVSLSEKASLTEKRLNNINTHFLNIIELSEATDILLLQYEKKELTERELVIKTRLKNKRIRETYESFDSDFMKISKTFENINSLVLKTQNYKEKANDSIHVLIENVNNEIANLSLENLGEIEKDIDESEKIKEGFLNELKKKSDKLKIIKNNLNVFKDKLNRV